MLKANVAVFFLVLLSGCFKFVANPDTSREQNRMETYVSQGRYQEACKLLLESSFEDGKFAEMHYVSGECHAYGLGGTAVDVEAAKADYRSAAFCGSERASLKLSEFGIPQPEDQFDPFESAGLSSAEARQCGYDVELTPTGIVVGAPLFLLGAVLALPVGIALVILGFGVEIFSIPFK